MIYWELLIFMVFSITSLFILLCVSPEGTGFLSKVSRFLLYTVPDVGYSLVLKVFGERLTNGVQKAVHYVIAEPNPIFQFVYLLLSIGGYVVYVFYGFPYIPNPYVHPVHMYFGSFVYFTALVTFILASINPPGAVTKKNLAKEIEYFKYDSVMYAPADCSTCKIQKPARSKHCNICGYCVLKQDHHCIWINQCVGYANYKYFLAFILSHSLICLYAGLIGFKIFKFIINKDRLWAAVFKDSTGKTLTLNYLTLFQYLLHRYSAFTFVIVLCIVVGFTLLCFFIYHFNLIRKNITSNERIKAGKLMEKGLNVNENFYNAGLLSNLSEVIEAEESI